MANTVTSYDNNQVIVDKLEALRTCVERRQYTLHNKIIAGLACDTTENVKLSLIAYLLEDYQKNAEDDKTKDCLQATPSVRKGWKIINVFLDYIQRECRDCFATSAVNFTAGDAGTGSTPPTAVTLLDTQDDDLFATQGGDNFLKR